MSSAAFSILTYHSLDDSNSVISVAPAQFRRHMEWLRDKGYQALSLPFAARLLREGGSTPDKAFVLTFDDGYANLYTHAFPLLQEFGWTATVFVITDFCGKLNDWPGHAASVERQPLLSWAHIEEMKKANWDIGAHTRTHPDLTRISPAEVEREITQSRSILEERLGCAVETFAYPYGKFSAKVKAIAARHFLAACTTRLGQAKAGFDLHALPRIEMYYLRDEGRLAQLENAKFEFYLQARQKMRDVKSLIQRH